MRKLLLLTIVVLVGLVFIARLFYLQIYGGYDYDVFEDSAIKKEYTYRKLVEIRLEMKCQIGGK